jgi:DNA polymerase-3 subunit epsilon
LFFDAHPTETLCIQLQRFQKRKTNIKTNSMRDFIAIDFETANQHRSSICAMGLVRVANGRIVDQYHTYIRPVPNFFAAWAVDIHGIKEDETYDAPNFATAWASVKTGIGALPLIAHNSAFDASCLYAALQYYGQPIPKNPFFCTYRKAQHVFPYLYNHKLPTVAAHLGFHLDHHHDALSDALACAHIALRVFS